MLIQIFFVKDFTSPGALQNYLHHVLAIFGAVAGNSIGRFIGTLSNITLITEITTPFVSNRWILHFHNKVDSTAYFINGLCMTIGFGLFRIVFLSYIVIFLAPSAFKQNDFSKDPQFVQDFMVVSYILYIVLLGLNCLWYKKMVAGCLKHLTVKPKNTESRDVTSFKKDE